MTELLKSFIEDSVEYFDQENWGDLWYKAETWLIDNKLTIDCMSDLHKLIVDDLGFNYIENIEVIPSYAFAGSDIEEIIIPDGCLHINPGAFMHCANLKEVVLPNTLQSIGDKAFFATSELETIEYTGLIEEWKQLRIGYAVFSAPSSISNIKNLQAKNGYLRLQ